MESTDHIPMDFDTAPGDYFADEISVTETVDKSGEKIKDKLKVQTELANPYLQYMRAKKKENPGIALNSTVIREQWAGLGEHERKEYIDL